MEGAPQVDLINDPIGAIKSHYKQYLAANKHDQQSVSESGD